MTKRPRGQCLIVNNEVFDHMKERRGSSADAANLKYLFTDLGFEVTVKPNLAEIDVKRQVRQFAQSEAHSKVRKNFLLAFAAFMTHRHRPLSTQSTLIGSTLRKISKLPSDGQKTKKLGINGHINISKGTKF